MVKPHSSNFRVITTNVLGVRNLYFVEIKAFSKINALLFFMNLCIFYMQKEIVIFEKIF